MTVEHDNLRTAVLWGLEHDLEKAIDLLCDLTLFWSRGGHNDEVIHWITLALSKLELAGAESALPSSLPLRARAFLTLGILSLQQGSSEAVPTLRESINLLRQADNKMDLAIALAFIGYLGDLEAAMEALRLYLQAAVVWHDLGLETAVARQFECIAMIQAAQRNYDHTARLSGIADRLRQQTGSQTSQREEIEYNQTLRAVRNQVDISLFQGWVSQGRSMTVKEALTYVQELPYMA